MRKNNDFRILSKAGCNVAYTDIRADPEFDQH